MDNDGPTDFVMHLLQEGLKTEAPPGAEARMRRHLNILQNRLNEQALTLPKPVRSTPVARHVFVQSAVISFAGILLACLLFFGLQSPSLVHAQVLDAVRGQTWLHAVSKAEDGAVHEWWCSPLHGIFGYRTDGLSVFMTHRSTSAELYDEAEATVLRMPVSEAERVSTNSLTTLLSELIMNRKATTVVSGALTIRVESEEVISNGTQRWLESRFIGKQKGESVGELILRSDPETHLPFACTFVQRNRETETVRMEFEIDFPTKGPGSIYGLGAPQSAKFVDRTKHGNERELVKEMEAVGKRFDTYYGVVVQTIGSNAWSDAIDIHRVWRKGNRFRIERGYGQPKGEKSVEGDVDATQWWLERAADQAFLPDYISDGKSVYHFQHLNILQADPNAKEYTNPKNPSLVAIHSIKQQQVTEFWKSSLGEVSHLLPDALSHPEVLIEAKPPRYPLPYIISVNEQPEDGPTGTVLLDLRHRGERLQYWIDVKREFMVTQHRFSGTQPDSTSIWTVDDVALSPQGNWYPTVVRGHGASRNLENGDRADLYTRFYLDFDADIPDSLFELSGLNFRKTTLDHALHLIDESVLPRDAN